MVGLVEDAVGGVLDAPEVDGVDARTEAAGDAGEVVVEAGAEGAGAVAEAIGGGVDEREDRTQVGFGGDDAREPEDGERGIVGVDCEADAGGGGSGGDGGEEEPEMFAERGGVDGGVAGEHRAEAIEGEAEAHAGEEVEGLLDERVAARGVEGFPVIFCGGADGGRVVGRGAGAGEGEQIEGGEFCRIVEQGLGAVGQDVAEIGAHPVEHGHEVINDDVDAGGAETFEGDAVVFEVALEVAGAGFDRFGNGDTLDHAPREAGGGDLVAARGD